MGLLDSITNTISGAVKSVESRAESTVNSYINSGTTLLKNTTSKLDAFNTAGGSPNSITQIQYPEDLTVSPDAQHYVTFYINVRGKSKIAQQSPDQLASPDPVSILGENRLDPTKMDNALKTVGTVGGAVGGLGIGWKIGKAAGKIVNAAAGARGTGAYKAGRMALATAGATAAVGAGVGAAVGGIATSLVVKPDTTYRLKDAITLHLSQAPAVTYGADYDTVEFGAIGGFLAGGSSYSDTLQQADKNTEALIAVARNILKGPAAMISADQGKALIEATTKQNLNPYKEVLFKSMGFRQFAFDYRFMPKSQAETDTIQKIIQTFKYHMHPEMSAGGMYYIHPSEFNIQYYFKGQENQYFNKISTCVLTNMHVDYGSAEQFASFANGAPVEIFLRLQFLELATQTKESIANGY